MATAPAIAFARGQLAYALVTALLFFASSASQRKSSHSDAIKGEKELASTRDAHASEQEHEQVGRGNPVSSQLEGYAAHWHADVAALQASMVFTWQECQKMALHEVTRCESAGPNLCGTPSFAPLVE